MVRDTGRVDDVPAAPGPVLAWMRSHAADRPTLGQVLDILGSAVVSVLAAPAGRSVPVAEPLILDTRDDLLACPGAILLAVGSRPGAAETLALVRAAADAQAGAVVVKTHGDDPRELVGAAESAGVALLAAHDRVSWQHLDGLLTAAVGSAGRAEKESLSAVAVGDLFALANAIAAAVGGAVAIEDPQQRVIAYSNLPGQPIDEIRQLGILGRQVPYDASYPAIYRRVNASHGALHVTGASPRDRLGSIWAVQGDAPLA